MLVFPKVQRTDSLTAQLPAAAVFSFPGGRMGRPKEDGPRHPCGKLVQGVGPTPELIERRRILVGDEKADHQKAGYPLGILRLRHQLTYADYSAAMRFCALHWLAFGRGSIKSHLEDVIYGLFGRDLAVIDELRREQKKRDAADKLGEALAVLHALPTRRPYSVLMNVGVYERPMRFMDTSRARTPGAWAADQRDLDALQEATDALATLWGIGRTERKAG